MIRYPASTTKAMTALLILENIDDLNQKGYFTDVDSVGFGTGKLAD